MKWRHHALGGAALNRSVDMTSAVKGDDEARTARAVGF